MTILEMLNRLAEIAPDVCQHKDDHIFLIGEYEFFCHHHFGFMAACYNPEYHGVSGRPALAWLADAIMAECEKRGWDYEHRFYDRIGTAPQRHKVIIINGKDSGHVYNTLPQALLAAFLAVMEGER